jgi:hypothetical protein
MATEKNEVKEEIVEAPIEEKKVTIRIPITESAQGDLFVSVNERTWLIQRGVEVTVPDYVADVISRAEDQQLKTLMMKQAKKK